eukprot:SAG22_NODE_10103_length_553_cov_0.640969_2_plen_106_part_00
MNPEEHMNSPWFCQTKTSCPTSARRANARAPDKVLRDIAAATVSNQAKRLRWTKTKQSLDGKLGLVRALQDQLECQARDPAELRQLTGQSAVFATGLKSCLKRLK